jgi:hypothetical protein
MEALAIVRPFVREPFYDVLLGAMYRGSGNQLRIAKAVAKAGRKARRKAQREIEAARQEAEAAEQAEKAAEQELHQLSLDYLQFRNERAAAAASADREEEEQEEEEEIEEEFKEEENSGEEAYIQHQGAAVSPAERLLSISEPRRSLAVLP